jgi:prepilin-type N-terminal cleavage/methylation domain-containing protein
MNALKKNAGSREPEAGNRQAFTLIELLVVIAVIAVIAAFLVVAGSAVKRKAIINRAQAELAQLETAIDRYHAAYGFYPPDSTNMVNNVPINQLYYELEGTIYDSTNLLFTTLDGRMKISAADATTAFGIGGFMNCTKPGAGEETRAAQTFLPDLKPNQIASVPVGPVSITNLVTSVGGPLPTYQPLGIPDANPWRYVSSSPQNNPGSYDLWVQIVIKPGQTILICNWKKQPQLNSPLP